VKITGANLNSSHGRNEQQQLTGLLVCNSEVTNKEGVEAGSNVSSGSPDDVFVDGGSIVVNTLMEGQEIAQVVGCSESTGAAHSQSGTAETSEEEDFLDLLVDTLDGDFDPNLLI